MVPELKKVEEGIALMKQLNELAAAEKAKAAEADGDEDASASSSPPSGPTHLDRYLAHTTKLFNEATKNLEDSQRDFKELCEYFGEELLDPEGLFGLVITFLRSIQAASSIAQAKAKRKARLNIAGK